jgi:hypothetical protein
VGSRRIPLHFEWDPEVTRNHSNFQRGYPLFKAYQAHRPPFSYPNIGTVVYGSLKDGIGETRPIAMEVNSNTYFYDGPVLVKYFRDGEMHTLFHETLK